MNVKDDAYRRQSRRYLSCITLAGRACAAVVSYTIDPSASSLTLSGDLEDSFSSPRSRSRGRLLQRRHRRRPRRWRVHVQRWEHEHRRFERAGHSCRPLAVRLTTMEWRRRQVCTASVRFPRDACVADVAFDIATGSLSDGVLPALVDISVTGTVSSAYLDKNPIGGNGICLPTSWRDDKDLVESRRSASVPARDGRGRPRCACPHADGVPNFAEPSTLVLAFAAFAALLAVGSPRQAGRGIANRVSTRRIRSQAV